MQIPRDEVFRLELPLQNSQEHFEALCRYLRDGKGGDFFLVQLLFLFWLYLAIITAVRSASNLNIFLFLRSTGNFEIH